MAKGGLLFLNSGLARQALHHLSHTISRSFSKQKGNCNLRMLHLRKEKE
jgi:hypothetical protein